MNNVQTILVPIDYSDCAPSVVRQGAQLASKLGAQVVLMHAVEPVAGVRPDVVMERDGASVTVGQHLRTAGESRMRAYLEVARAEGVHASVQLVDGKPTDAILAAVDTIGADLIVMGTHGRQGLQRMLLGSVAEHVVRRASVPVLTVRSQWHAGCEAKSCATCKAHVINAMLDVESESDG